eukprot:g11301.t1
MCRVAPELTTLQCEDRIQSASMEWDLVGAQGLAVTTCLYRNRHVDWLLFSDLDEAVVPGIVGRSEFAKASTVETPDSRGGVVETPIGSTSSKMKNHRGISSTTGSSAATFKERLRRVFGSFGSVFSRELGNENRCQVVPVDDRNQKLQLVAPANSNTGIIAPSSGGTKAPDDLQKDFLLRRPAVISGVFIPELTYGGPDDLRSKFLENVGGYRRRHRGGYRGGYNYNAAGAREEEEEDAEVEKRVLTDPEFVTSVWPTPWARWQFRLAVPKVPLREFLFPTAEEQEQESSPQHQETTYQKTSSTSSNLPIYLNETSLHRFGLPGGTVMRTTNGEKENLLSESTHEGGEPRFVFEGVPVVRILKNSTSGSGEGDRDDVVEKQNATLVTATCSLSQEEVFALGRQALAESKTKTNSKQQTATLQFLEGATSVAPDEYRPIRDTKGIGSRKSFKGTAVRPGETLVVGLRSMRGRAGTQIHVARMAELSVHHYRYALRQAPEQVEHQDHFLESVSERMRLANVESVEELYPSKVEDPAGGLRKHTVFDPVFTKQLEMEEGCASTSSASGRGCDSVDPDPNPRNPDREDDGAGEAEAAGENTNSKQKDGDGFSCTEVVADHSALQRALERFFSGNEEHDDEEEEDLFGQLGVWLQKVLQNLDEGPIDFKRFLSLVYDNFVELKTVPNFPFDAETYTHRRVDRGRDRQDTNTNTMDASASTSREILKEKPVGSSSPTTTLRDALLKLVFSPKWSKLIRTVAKRLQVSPAFHASLHPNALYEDSHRQFAEFDRGDAAFKDKDENFLIPILYLANLQDLKLKSVSGPRALKDYRRNMLPQSIRPQVLGYERRAAEESGVVQKRYAVEDEQADRVLEELDSIEEIYGEENHLSTATSSIVTDMSRVGYTEKQVQLLQLLSDRVFSEVRAKPPNYKTEFLATFPSNHNKCHLRVSLLARSEEILAWYLEETAQRTEMFQSQVNRFSRLALNQMHVRPSAVDDPILLLFYYLLADALFPLLYAYNREHRLAFDQIHRHYLRENVLTKDMAKGFFEFLPILALKYYAALLRVSRFAKL